MTGLVVEAIAVAVLERPAYLSIADFVPDPDMMALARAVAERNELPLERLRFLADRPDLDVASVALDELGPPRDKQPVLLVRSGSDPDPFVSALARMVTGRPWVDEELGLTHLDELGGTAVLEFLDWFMPDSGATVLIVDQSPIMDVQTTRPSPAAVALRVGRGCGLIRVVSWGRARHHRPWPTGSPVRARAIHGSICTPRWLAVGSLPVTRPFSMPPAPAGRGGR